MTLCVVSGITFISNTASRWLIDSVLGAHQRRNEAINSEPLLLRSLVLVSGNNAHTAALLGNTLRVRVNVYILKGDLLSYGLIIFPFFFRVISLLYGINHGFT